MNVTYWIKSLHESSHRILFFRANNLQGNLAQMQTLSKHFSHCCKDFQKRRSAKFPYVTAWNPSLANFRERFSVSHVFSSIVTWTWFFFWKTCRTNFTPHSCTGKQLGFFHKSGSVATRTIGLFRHCGCISICPDLSLSVATRTKRSS